MPIHVAGPALLIHTYSAQEPIAIAPSDRVASLYIKCNYQSLMAYAACVGLFV